MHAYWVGGGKCHHSVWFYLEIASPFYFTSDRSNPGGDFLHSNNNASWLTKESRSRWGWGRCFVDVDDDDSDMMSRRCGLRDGFCRKPLFSLIVRRWREESCNFCQKSHELIYHHPIFHREQRSTTQAIWNCNPLRILILITYLNVWSFNSTWNW